jgi:hypothetical protein
VVPRESNAASPRIEEVEGVEGEEVERDDVRGDDETGPRCLRFDSAAMIRVTPRSAKSSVAWKA